MNLLATIIPLITTVLDRTIPDPNKRAELQLELSKVLQENEGQIVQAMSSTMAADSASESWLTRNSRPIVVMWCLVIVTLIVIESAFGNTTYIINAVEKIPSPLWNLITVGIGGYMLLRTGEKIANSIGANRGR